MVKGPCTARRAVVDTECCGRAQNSGPVMKLRLKGVLGSRAILFRPSHAVPRLPAALDAISCWGIAPSPLPCARNPRRPAGIPPHRT